MSDGLDEVDSESMAASPFHNVELFQGLDADELREILHACERRVFQPGDVLFAEGESATSMFLVEAGELEVRARGDADDDVVLAVRGAGSVVGEMSILDGFSLRSATVKTIAEVAAFELSRDVFTQLRDQQRHAAYKLILNLAKILGERRRRTDTRVAEVFADPSKHIDAFEAQVHDLIGRLKKA